MPAAARGVLALPDVAVVTAVAQRREVRRRATAAEPERADVQPDRRAGSGVRPAAAATRGREGERLSLARRATKGKG